MKLSFYPGCSLEGMANDYARSISDVFKYIDIELIEIEDWSCCGSTAAHSLDEAMSVALPARNLAAAEKMGLDIVSPCAMCFNRLKFSQIMVQKQIYDVPWPVTGDIAVHDMTRFLAEPEMIARIRQCVVRPLANLRVVCFYGCQMVRPPKLTGFTDYENPQTLDRIMTALGVQSLDWSYKATCCGASIGIGRKEIQEALTRRLLHKVRQTGAQAVVVSCPLCQSNLDVIQMNSARETIPIFYFTELLRLAFEGRVQSSGWMKTHFADPLPLIDHLGFV